ncbi:hypothetical protein scyTo_0021107 [Scyliorhinus torazame]|uniref:Ig-like domain-containing protein n=1 Tax=Scyliorhinus torazame TaxID=75743 RepID=A0A401PWJ5_SCYTO|nr:hypothetical protein [Scyliorhinus torazame]
MEPARLLFVLIVQFASGWADPRVTQDPLTGPVALGETVKLKCNLHGASAGTYEINWVRQAPGKTPQGVLVHATDRKIYRAPGITDRFTPSAQDSSLTYYLTVGNVEAADGAVYYCMIWISNIGYTVIHAMTKTSSETSRPPGTLLLRYLRPHTSWTLGTL